MKRFVRDLAGGLVVIVAAGVIGILVNTVRGDSIPLIQKIKPVSTAQHGVPADPSSVPEESITAERVKNLISIGDVFIIDARPAADYDAGHIPTAINVPYDRLPDYIDDLTSLIGVDAEVICYCTGPSCDFSDQIATELKFLGYTRVVVFTGGWEHWEAAGFEVEITEEDR
jgi:rhodanese-related sulfurtransferase